MTDKKQLSELIKSKAKALGFEGVGFSRAEKLEGEEDHLKTWLDLGYHGQMDYMEKHFEKRLDPRELLPGVKSVISLMYNYYPETTFNNSSFKIARYAYGKDYHRIIKKRLKAFTFYLNELVQGTKFRVFVDSAPIMERQWAAKSGLGWLGKNTLMINKEKGSYFFLAEVLVDMDLEYDGPIRDHCGSCTACLDSCPTDAFEGPYVLNASKCISYMTIELKDEIDNRFKGKLDKWIFGCDVCQEVCPWNRFSSPHEEESFNPPKELMDMNDRQWLELTDDQFNRIFKGSAVKRTKFKGLKRNIEFLSED
ncbi:MAG: tRNA epoxyqueuosine(34) reductase QueG [Vicingaceae bacterium]